MEHIAAFMLLIACSDDLSSCEEIPTTHIAYQTVQACENDIENQLRNQDIMAPVAVAECKAVDPLALNGDVMISWSLDDDKDLQIEIVYGDAAAAQEMASYEASEAVKMQ